MNSSTENGTPMKIYFFRHAQKATDFSGDPDLTVEGHAQASKLLDKVRKQELPQPAELWVSPKKRTHSTFRPLSAHFKLSLQIHEGLLNNKPMKLFSNFRSRIQKVLIVRRKNKACSFYVHTMIG